MAKYILAYDLGTTANKVVLFRKNGEISASVSVAYATHYPRPGWAWQNPQDWWITLVKGTRNIISKTGISAGEILGVGFCAHMNGCLAVDAKGRALYPSIIHADSRSVAQCEKLNRVFGAEKIYELTGNVLDVHYTLPKILWLKENEPSIFKRASFFIQAKDYLAWRLTGCGPVTDYSDASMTEFFDIKEKKWSEPIVKFLGIKNKLPRLCLSSEIVGKVSSETARETGLLCGTPVVIGGGDGGCAAVGAGAIETGDVYNYIGATSWLSCITSKPLIEKRRRLFNICNLDGKTFQAIGTVQCAGDSYKWIGEILKISDYKILDSEAARSSPGSNGLFFLPYMMGERAPLWDPYARGAFYGLTLSSKRPDIVRSVLEGVSFALNSILEIMEESGLETDEVRLIGGGAKGKLWREILGNVYGKRLLLPENLEQATSYGAGIAAGIGLGVFKDYSVAKKLNGAKEMLVPDGKMKNVYKKLYLKYKTLYPALKSSFRELYYTNQEGESLCAKKDCQRK